ncbi:MAG: class I SAM-dependent methyltransferase [Anaerolineaceae bacterium]|nr:class I SAM-dependent methyltransferase [Anaerolineaceae bacterium]
MINCPYCQSQGKLFWKQVNFFKCVSCGLIFKNNKFENNELASIYLEKWRLPIKNVSETGGTTHDLARIYIQKIKEDLDVLNFNGKKIMEFGAGKGELIHVLKNQGADVIAIEPYGYEFLSTKQINAYRYLHEVDKKVLFDGVISIDVIEHLEKPWETLSDIYKFMKPGAWIILATPNPNSLNAKLTKSNWREAKKNGHLVFFQQSTLQSMLLSSGFSNTQILDWDIEYKKANLSKLKNCILRKFKLNGELRVLAFKPIS